MLTAHHLTKTYGIQPILQDVSFSISIGERLGLVGPNGSGKTTLVRILAGLEQPDKGTVVHTRQGLRIGYLAQGMDFDPDQTLRSALQLASVSESELESKIASLASALASNPDNEILQEKYDLTLQQLSSLQSPPPLSSVLLAWVTLT
jgi:ATPase subunit of ABC transporter with duplicated ATPase domains